MPRSRGILPEGAPSELFEYLKVHPGSTVDQAIDELKLHRSTAYYALSRLFDQGLIERYRKRTRRGERSGWKVVGQELEPVRLVPPAAPPATPISMPAAADSCLSIRTRWIPQPTGMPYTVVDGKICPTDSRCTLQVFTVNGAQPERERDYSREGRINVPGTAHPWSYESKVRG